MYERFYGLTERPFDLTPNPRYLCLTPKHREALTHLQYGVSGGRGITLLVGEAGTGKTTLVYAALEQQRDRNALCVYVSNPLLTRAEFFEFLAEGFGLGPAAAQSKTRFLLELTRNLLSRQKTGAITALIIDEAQGLPDELLEEVRLLANIETAVEKLLPVVLVGQPELAERLNQPSLRQFKQRVALRCALPALDAAETAAYIATRVRVGGGDSAGLFSSDAIDTIFRCSGGIPRTISVICDSALVSGFASDERPVGRDTVLDVCRDFDLHEAATSTDLPAASAPPAIVGQLPAASDPSFF